ncbi:hypothetical protein [Streptomyces sp. NPDC101234]|uniref:hypothetical protein n=1 Tax=Streptomyces sp. NPDC101234 TaxID=3366138 RepID=UPI003826B570
MTDNQNQGAGQTPAAPPPAPPTPQPDIVDIYTNQALIGTEKKSDTNPTITKAVRPQSGVEYR